MKKRNMSLILVLALILCLIPATAFADTAETLSGQIKAETIISKDTTTSGNVTVGGNAGKIVVTNGATLTIPDGSTLDLTSSTSSDRVLEIQKGCKLVVNGSIYSISNFGDVKQLGTMVVSGTGAKVVMDGKNSKTVYIGKNGLITLDSNAVITSTPLTAGTYEDGYKYVISGGTATTNNFTNSGKDELVVANGAVLDAKGGLTLGGSSAKQLTVQDGGKLVTGYGTGETTLANIFGATTAVTQAKITSGTYTENPKDYVAEGYTVTKTTGVNEWTVKPAGYLTKIAVTVKDPVVGETPATTFKSTVTDKGSATAVESDGQLVCVWFKVAKNDYVAFDDEDAEEVWTLVKEGEKFQKDYYYAFITYFKVADGYEISDNLAVTVNGKEADDVVTGLYRLSADDDTGIYGVVLAKEFGPLAEKSPATGDNNELGLFAVAGLISALGVALMLRRKHSM